MWRGQVGSGPVTEQGAEQTRRTRSTVLGVMRRVSRAASRGQGDWPTAETKGLVGPIEDFRVHPEDRRVKQTTARTVPFFTFPRCTASCEDQGHFPQRAQQLFRALVTQLPLQR